MAWCRGFDEIFGNQKHGKNKDEAQSLAELVFSVSKKHFVAKCKRGADAEDQGLCPCILRGSYTKIIVSHFAGQVGMMAIDEFHISRLKDSYAIQAISCINILIGNNSCAFAQEDDKKILLVDENRCRLTRRMSLGKKVPGTRLSDIMLLSRGGKLRSRGGRIRGIVLLSTVG